MEALPPRNPTLSRTSLVIIVLSVCQLFIIAHLKINTFGYSPIFLATLLTFFTTFFNFVIQVHRKQEYFLNSRFFRVFSNGLKWKEWVYSANLLLSSMNFYALPANLAINIREDYTENFYGWNYGAGKYHPNQTSVWTYLIPSVIALILTILCLVEVYQVSKQKLSEVAENSTSGSNSKFLKTFYSFLRKSSFVICGILLVITIIWSEKIDSYNNRAMGMGWLGGVLMSILLGAYLFISVIFFITEKMNYKIPFCMDKNKIKYSILLILFGFSLCSSLLIFEFIANYTIYSGWYGGTVIFIASLLSTIALFFLVLAFANHKHDSNQDYEEIFGSNLTQQNNFPKLVVNPVASQEASEKMRTLVDEIMQAPVIEEATEARSIVGVQENTKSLNQNIGVKLSELI